MVAQFGAQFTDAILSWLQGMTVAHDVVTWRLSFIELAVIALTELQCPLPQPHPDRRLHWIEPTQLAHSQVRQPTLSSAVRLVKAFAKTMNASFDFDLPLLENINLSHFGIAMPLSGFGIMISREVLKRTENRLLNLTRRRRITKSTDLARPLC